MHQLFNEIKKFYDWAEKYSDIPQEERGGEWECAYPWSKIYFEFKDFIHNSDPNDWTKEMKNNLLYIIARDNECEQLANCVSNSEESLIALTAFSLKHGPRDAKWQLAVQLHKLSDRKQAEKLLEAFVNDPEEYVNRRALLELADIHSEKVEYYCEKFWNRNKYGDMDEFQRIAVIHALKRINSQLLQKYLDLGKLDGRKYLVDNVREIETTN